MSSFAGKFLVAKTNLQEAAFRQSVVLLLQHGDAGAFGLVVNRAVTVEGLPFPVFAGGPCESQGLLMLHGHAEWAESSTEPPPREVAPGIFLGDASCLSRLNDAPAEQGLRYRIFSGYAGWSAGQLENELSAGGWLSMPASEDYVFFEGDDLWERVVKEIGHEIMAPATKSKHVPSDPSLCRIASHRRITARIPAAHLTLDANPAERGVQKGRQRARPQVVIAARSEADDQRDAPCERIGGLRRRRAGRREHEPAERRQKRR